MGQSGLKVLGRAAVLLGAIALSASPALAGKASFSIPPGAVLLAGDAEMTDTLVFPGSERSAVRFGFVLPRDYREDSPVKVVLLVDPHSRSCEMQFDAPEVDRIRKGELRVGGRSGFSVRKDGRVAVDSGRNSVNVTFVIRPGELMEGQRSGDGLLVTVQRDGNAANDTCDSADIYAINVIYRTRG